METPSPAARAPTPPRLRRARPADAEVLARIHVAAWRDAYAGILPATLLARLDVDARARSWREILGQTRPGLPTLLAVRGGETVGFAGWMPSRDPDADTLTGELAAIYLVRAAWGSGVGARLHDACID